jgi:hypothetical protein
VNPKAGWGGLFHIVLALKQYTYTTCVSLPHHSPSKTCTYMPDHSLYLVTTTEGEQFDLTTAKEIRSNNLFPFGLHNYAIYQTADGVFIKGLNSGNGKLMLDRYEKIAASEARNYVHPHFRIEEE